MEPSESGDFVRRRRRQNRNTNEEMVKRAKLVRSELMLGKSIREISSVNGLTIGETRQALKWLGRWTNNAEAFGEFKAGELNRLEAIQRQVNAVMGEAGATEVDKAHALVKLFDLSHKIRFNIIEVGLRLGMLDREVIKVEHMHTKVSFGDEHDQPWFTKKAIDIPAETANLVGGPTN